MGIDCQGVFVPATPRIVFAAAPLTARPGRLANSQGLSILELLPACEIELQSAKQKHNG